MPILMWAGAIAILLLAAFGAFTLVAEVLASAFREPWGAESSDRDREVAR
jgi:hypothetical protein